MFVSIIICTRNRKMEMLRICKSIATQTFTNFELIIVDSSSEDKFQKADIQDLFQSSKEINIIYSEPGLTKQRNIGLKAANGALFFFFDDDLILENDFLEEMINVFNSNKDYYGGMGAFTKMEGFTSKQRIRKIIRRFFLLQLDFGNGKFQKSGFPRHPYGSKVFLESEVIAGGITAYKKEVFDELEFDEHFSNYSYMEDVDFSRRVSLKHKLFYNPDALAEHRHGEGGRGNHFENRHMLMYNHRYLFEKNFPQSKSNIIAHFWSIIGLYVFDLITFNRPLVSFKAFTRGLVDYRTAKKNQSF